MVECEQRADYVEAEMTKNRISELKVQDYERKKQEIEFNQEQQVRECEEAHIRQYEQFNSQWDADLYQTQ